MFNNLNEFIEKKRLQWKCCIGVRTDGAAEVTGQHLEVVVRIKRIFHSDLIAIHCFFHHAQLASKDMAP
jgi:hypothetical protein